MKDAITHITEDVSVLLGQDNSWEVNNAGELHSAWRLAVEPLVENSLGIFGFDDIHRFMRWPAAPFQPLQISFVYSLRFKPHQILLCFVLVGFVWLLNEIWMEGCPLHLLDLITIKVMMLYGVLLGSKIRANNTLQPIPSHLINSPQAC